MGKKRRYGSVRFKREQSSFKSFECLIFGGLAMFLQSIFVKVGSAEKVQFQSPPRITGQLPKLIIAALSLVKKIRIRIIGTIDASDNHGRTLDCDP